MTCCVNGGVWRGRHLPGPVGRFHVRSIRRKLQQEAVSRYDTQLPVRREE